MKLKVAIVGAGRMAGYIDEEVEHYPAIQNPFSHAAAYDLCDKTEVVAVCATKQESLDRFMKRWNIPNGYLDYEEMIIKEKPDILSVVTHADLHAPISTYAAEQGVKGIYCEKPIALSLDESDRLIAVCREQNTKLMVGHLRRFHNAFRSAREYIASGEMGKLVAVNTIHSGELFHTGTHNFDLLNMMIGGDVEWVQASADVPREELNTGVIKNDAAGVGIIRYKNGVTAYVHARGRYPAVYEQEFICEDGIIHVYNNGVNWELRRMEEFKRPVPKDGPTWAEVPSISISVQKEVPFSTEINSMTLSAVESLVKAVTEDGETVSSGEDARQALEIGLGFLHSELAGGKRVPLPLKDRSMVVHAR